MDTTYDGGDDFSLVIDDSLVGSGDELPPKITEEPQELQSETSSTLPEVEKSSSVNESKAPVLSPVLETASKVVLETSEKAPKLQPAISPDKQRDGTKDGATGNVTVPAQKTSFRSTTIKAVVEKQPRSTRSSINPDFAAKQRKFLSRVQNAYLHIQAGDTSSCESDSEAIPEERSEDTSPEYVPGLEDSPSRRNSITNVNGLKRRREECNSTKGVKVGIVHNLEEAATIKLGSGDEHENGMGQTTVKRPKFVYKITSEGDLCDWYCWYCHRESVNLKCASCPRSYHVRCLRSPLPKGEWVCPECVNILKAETSETRSEAMKMLSLDQLCNLLKYTISRMKACPGADVFEFPVDEGEFPSYKDYIINPMDISRLEKNIENKMYGSTEAFIADAMWIYHNCVIFNTYQSKLTVVARNLIRLCKQEVSEVEICPDCYLHAHTCDENWFIQVCRKPHLLVWAKLKGFPFWPGKAMRFNTEDMVDVRFFGAHDRAWVPSRDCLLYTQENPNTSTKVPKKRNIKHSLEACVEEVELHIKLLKEQFLEFNYAPARIRIDPKNKIEQLKMLLPLYVSSGSSEIKVYSSPKSIRTLSRSRCSSSREQVEGADENIDSTSESGPTSKKLKTVLSEQADSTSSIKQLDAVVKMPAMHSATEDIARQRLQKRDARKIGLVDRIQEKLSLMTGCSSPPNTSETNGLNSSEDHVSEDVESEVNTFRVSEMKQMNHSDSSLAEQEEKQTGDEALCTDDQRKETDLNGCVRIKTEPTEASEVDGSDLNNVIVHQPLTSPNQVDISKSQPKVLLTKLKLGSKQVPSIPGSNCASTKGESLKELDKKEPNIDVSTIKTEFPIVVPSTNSDSVHQTENIPAPKVKENVIKRPITILSPSCLSARSKSLPKPKESAPKESAPKQSPTWHKIGEGPVGLTEPNMSITVIKEPEPTMQTSESEEDRRTVKARNLYPCVTRNVSLSVTRTLMPAGDVPKEITNSKVVVAGTVQVDAAQQEQDGGLKNTARKTVSMRNGQVPVSSGILTKFVGSPPKSSSVPTPVSRIIQQVPTSILKSSNITVADGRSANIVLTSKKLSQVMTPSQRALSGAALRPSSSASCVFVSSPSSCLSFSSAGTNTATNVIPIVRIIPTTLPNSVLTPTTLDVSSPSMLPSSAVSCSTQSHTIPTISATNQNARVATEVVTESNIVPGAFMGPISSTLQTCAGKMTDMIASAMQGLLYDLGSMGNLEAKVRCLQLDLEHLKWRHQLEIQELKHNSDLVIAEMRESMKLEMERTLADATSAVNAEKEAAVAATKRRQWCAFCSKEAMFYCCWNTSYCDFACQVNHWPVHSLTCTQNPSNNAEQAKSVPVKAPNPSLKSGSSSNVVSSTQKASRSLPALPRSSSTSSSLPTMKGIPFVIPPPGGATTNSGLTVVSAP